jgi:hypothetical protein
MSLIALPPNAITTARSRTTTPGAWVSHERTESNAPRSRRVNEKRSAANRSNAPPVWLSTPRPFVVTTNRSPRLLRCTFKVKPPVQRESSRQADPRRSGGFSYAGDPAITHPHE